MSGHNRITPISTRFLLFFILKSFVPISAELQIALNINQICPQMFLCHPKDPALFQQCVPNYGMVIQECQKGLLFNSVINACDWPQNSNCVLNTTTSPNSVGAATGPTSSGRDSFKIDKSKILEDSKEKQKKYYQNHRTTPKPRRRWQDVVKAGNCKWNDCKLPNCKCADDSIPGSLKPETVPQIVMLTFDDNVNIHNMGYYQNLMDQHLTNPDGCPIGLTFFVSGGYNDYKFIEKLYQHGHEIASHSKTHRFPISWWSKASYKDFENEMVGMQNILSKRSSIPIEKIKGIRVPFLQLDGDAQYQVLKDNNFTWDSSMVARRYERPIWPFTLDYHVTRKNCQIDRCPKGSYPGLWEIPLIQWRDSDGKLYAMPDENMKPKSKIEMIDFLRENFDVHYKTNRAPFGIFIHATWFKKKEFNFAALSDFLKYLAAKEDVWIIPVSRTIDWVRNPKPIRYLSQIPSWNCKKPRIIG